MSTGSGQGTPILAYEDAYATLAELRADAALNLSGSETADDGLLDDLLVAVKQLIDSHTGRTFAASEDSTRNFDAVRDTEGLTLYIRDDLASITEITNGDGDEIESTEYVTEPRNVLDPNHANYAPIWAIKIKASSGKTWTYTDDPEDAIAVEGLWAYSENAPNDIKQANIIGAAALYRQSLSGDNDRPIIAGGGVVIQPSQMPATFWALLARYVRKI